MTDKSLMSGRCKVFLRFVDERGYAYDIIGEADSIECVRETIHSSRGRTLKQNTWFTHPYIDILDFRRSLDIAPIDWNIDPRQVKGDYPQGPPVDNIRL